MTKQKALFLDRDGIINIDHGYVSKIEDFTFTEGIFELLHLFTQKGYLLFIITNQSGLGRGYYTLQDFDTLTSWMLSVLNTHDITIEKVAYCPHAPEASCHCRKPQTGMIKDILKYYPIDLTNSWLIGDKQSDIDLAQQAKIVQSIAIGSHDITHASYQFDTVMECYTFLNSQQGILL